MALEQVSVAFGVPSWAESRSLRKIRERGPGTPDAIAVKHMSECPFIYEYMIFLRSSALLVTAPCEVPEHVASQNKRFTYFHTIMMLSFITHCNLIRS